MENDAPEPPPPWVAYPGTEPTWSGWRQGKSEAWFLEQWLPFWSPLDDTARAAYLERHARPDEAWRAYLARLARS